MTQTGDTAKTNGKWCTPSTNATWRFRSDGGLGMSGFDILFRYEPAGAEDLILSHLNTIPYPADLNSPTYVYGTHTVRLFR
jgi:hypothetical protein